MIRLLMVLVVLVPATAWYAGQILWAVRRRAPDMRCTCDRSPRAWARFLLRVAGVDVVLENEEVLRENRPRILVANHSSWFDVLALAARVPGRYVFVAKKEIERFPLFGSAARQCGHVFVDRQDRSQAVQALEAARRNLEEESLTIIIFPEGTRSATGEVQEFKKGAFVLAIQTGTDVLPTAISGSRRIMRKGSLLIRSGTIRVRFGAPIPTTSYDLAGRTELTRTAREALLALQVPERD